MGGGSDGGGRTSLVVKIEQNVPFIQDGENAFISVSTASAYFPSRRIVICEVLSCFARISQVLECSF